MGEDTSVICGGGEDCWPDHRLPLPPLVLGRSWTGPQEAGAVNPTLGGTLGVECAGVGGGSTAMSERLSAKRCAGSLYSMLTLILTATLQGGCRPCLLIRKRSQEGG